MTKVPYVNLAKQHAAIKGELLEAVSQVIDQGHFILGPFVEKCEKQFAHYCGVKYAVGINSGTDALALALMAYDIKGGDEVIIPPDSFLATASSVIFVGAKPIFADVNDDLNISPDKIEAAITSKTKAIIAVHLSGKPAKMDEIKQIAKRYELKVIEDAAQAVGTEYKGVKTGALSDIGCFSLHPLKTLNACGDAGVMTTNDQNVYEKLLQLRNIGLKNRNESEIWGINSRLDNLQGAVLSVKMNYLDSWIQKRRENALFYDQHLKGWLDLPKELSHERHSYHTYVVQTSDRDNLRDYLESKGIETKIHYPIPIHLQVCAKSLGAKRGDFPVSERLANEMLSLPIHQDLTPEELLFVVEQIKAFFFLKSEKENHCAEETLVTSCV